MDRHEILAVRTNNLGPTCAIFFKHDPLHIDRAQGTYMYDKHGKRYIDCINNVSHVGHSHPRIAKVAFEQLQKLNTNSRYLYDCLAEYLVNLCSTLPDQLSVVFFANSGSEATDLALKLAREHAKSKETVTLEHAYHGHVMSAYEISPYKWEFLDPSAKPDYVHIAKVPDVYRGKYRDTAYSPEKLGELFAQEVIDICDNLEAQSKKVGCFIAESLQSCGGQIVYPPGYLAKVYEAVRSRGGVCIADEVQTGFGRVGHHWWAFQTQNVIPDIVTMGKPMGNGFPISAVVTTPEIAKSLEAIGMEFFNTFGGSPVACVVGNEVLNIIREEKLREQAAAVGKYLMDSARKLQNKHAIIGDVRGVGLFVGIDLTKDLATREPADKSLCKNILNDMKDRGVLLSLDGPHNNVLKFKPPLTFSMDDVDFVMKVLDEVLDRNCRYG